MRVLFRSLVLVLLLSTSSWATTVTLDLAWSVTNTPTVPASYYRVEENVAGVWGAVVTVPATQLTYQITGRAVGGLYSFRVMPVKDGVDGTVSNISVCGALAPDSTLSLTCTASVVP